MSIAEWDFSNTLPLPYRVLIVSVIGVWAWGLNLQILSSQSIDVNVLLSSSQEKKYIPTHRPIYTLALILSFLIFFSLSVFWQVTGGVQVKIIEWTVIPLSCYVIIFLIIFCPFNIFCLKERYRFLKCLRRVFFSGFKQEVYFSDVIIADIMTSFAKVWGDLYVTGCILLFFDINQEGISRNRCYGDVIAPLFTSIPYIIRFKQCITCYFTPKNTSRNHLFNALKYASAFPVILFSAMQKWNKEEEKTTFFRISSILIFKLWIISVAINSFYSFYWDVAKDWKLEFFNSITTKYYFIPSFKLRSTLHFREPIIYYIAIFIDFILRFTWSFKLSSHLHIIHQLEGGVFLMECLEIVRRWLWLFFRIESEFIENFDKKNYGLINNAKTSNLELNEFNNNNNNNHNHHHLSEMNIINNIIK
ncbi:hypothetical protein Glove_603g5 [Diversispora epigaea]|uniref:EXS domain-containing protein n=1 Tax=Diversispora epigaea TaxID=1348612 RepID=A0A397GA54_9GLOM|nr:hypothetical protein Glove_603g5 [Diversispora epigaea]